MKKLFALTGTLLILSSCGLSPYSVDIQAEPTDASDQIIKSEDEKNALEAQGYECHRQILTQKSEDCYQTSVGEVCSPAKVTYGDWICGKPKLPTTEGGDGGQRVSEDDL